MNYYLLNPENIQVFPFGKTRRVDTNARVLNEQNITNLVRMLTDKKSYVVSFDTDTHVMEFVLEGYYFKTDLNNIWADLFSIPDLKNIYANISLNTVSRYSYLQGGDSVYTSAIGSGTYQDPYILVEGHFESSIERIDDTDNDTYYSYTFKEDGDILIKCNPNINITVSGGHNSTDSDEFVRVTGTSGQTVNIVIALNSSSSKGEVAIDVLYSSKFTGLMFTKDSSITDHSLHILTPRNSSLVVPENSYLKHEPRSFSLDFDGINCGTASELI